MHRKLTTILSCAALTAALTGAALCIATPALAQMHQDEYGRWVNSAGGNPFGDSRFNADADPNFNANADPAFNSNVDPRFNADADPRFNANANPDFSPSGDPSFMHNGMNDDEDE